MRKNSIKAQPPPHDRSLDPPLWLKVAKRSVRLACLWKRVAAVKIDKTYMKQMFADRLLRLCSGFDYLRHWRGFFVGRDSPVNV